MKHPPLDLTPGDPTPSPDDPLDPALGAALRGLHPLSPPRDLWPEISARLDAARPEAARPEPSQEAAGPGRVLAFRAPNPATARPASRRWLAAAAAAIAVVSSGATYLAVRHPAAPQLAAAPPAAAAPRPAPPRVPPLGTPDATAPAVGEAATGTPDAAPDSPRRTEGEPAAPARLAERAERRRPDAALRGPLRTVADPGPVDAAVPGAAEYDRQIAQLRSVVADRHSELDSATVDVLARNLQIIDAAIAASRAALRRDPHSPFLGEQLTRALGQKVDLLRTAALLPRT